MAPPTNVYLQSAFDGSSTRLVVPGEMRCVLLDALRAPPPSGVGSGLRDSKSPYLPASSHCSKPVKVPVASPLHRYLTVQTLRSASIAWGGPPALDYHLQNLFRYDLRTFPCSSVSISATLTSPLKGGKGGFGALLKAVGKKAGKKKTTDFGACRDLNGRRLRHINDEIKVGSRGCTQYVVYIT